MPIPWISIAPPLFIPAPIVRIFNTFEGGVNGVNISTGNSGGASGDAFDSVAGLAFSNTVVAHGGLSAYGNFPDFRYDEASFGRRNEFWGRAYIYMAGRPSGNVSILIASDQDAAKSAGIVMTSAGTIRLYDDIVFLAAGSVATPLSAWWRIEWHFRASSIGTGIVEVKLFTSSMDATTPDEVLTINSSTSGSEIFNRWRFRPDANFADVYIDDINFNTDSYPGPLDRVVNSFEGGTDGVAITRANSGGTSGDTFDTSEGSDYHLDFDNTRAAHGTYSGVNNDSSPEVAYDYAFPENDEHWGRMYLYMTDNPPLDVETLYLTFGNALTPSLDASSAGIKLRTTRKLRVQGNDAVDGLVNVAFNQWIRIEFHFKVGGTGVGIAEVKLFNTMDSTTPDEIITYNGTDDLPVGGATGSGRKFKTFAFLDSVFFSVPGVWIDDLQLNLVGYPGPAA